MPRKARLAVILIAAIAVGCLVASIWYDQYMWKLLFTGGFLLLVSAVITAIFTAPVKK